MPIKIKIDKIFLIICFLFGSSLRAVSEDSLTVKQDSLPNFPQTSVDSLLAPLSADSSGADSARQRSVETVDSGFDTTLFYDARIIDTELDSNRYYLIGEAVVKYQKMTLTAAKIVVDQKNELLIAEGMPDTTWVFNADSTEKEMKIEMSGLPEFSEGNEKLVGDKMIYNYRTQKGRVLRGRTDYESGKYYGEQIKKVEGKIYNVTNARFTTCDKLDEPHFYFKARRMKIIQNKEIVGKPIVMYVADIPVAYLPFVFFPNKGGRHSGILIPRYGESAVEGRYLQGLGYYWAPSDYFDLTTKVNYYDRSGWMADGAFRYKKRYLLEGRVNGSITKKEYISGREQNRWDLRIYHNQQMSPTTRLQVNGNFVSDASFYKSYSSNIDQRLNRQLNSNATFTKSWPESKNNLTVNLSHTKYLDTDREMMVLPQLSFSHSMRQLFPPKKSKTRRATVRRRDTEREDRDKWYHSIYYSYRTTLINQLEQGKADPIARNINHNASLSMNSPQKLFGILGWNHSLNYDEIWFDRYKEFYYDAAFDSAGKNPVQSKLVKGFASVRSFGYSASANTKIYGMFAPNIGNITAIRHVVTPNISFSYSPNFQDPFWGYYQDVRRPDGEIISSEYRYLGGYASEGRKTLGFNVRNLFQMKTVKLDKDGKEIENKFDLFTLNFSSGYNFKRDQFKMDALNTSLSANPTRNISVRFSARNDFYKYDQSTKQRVNKLLPLEWKLPRLTSFSANMSIRLQGKKKESARASATETEEIAAEEEEPFGGDQFDGYYDDDRFEVTEAFTGLDIPWSASLSLDYSLSRLTPDNTTKRFYLRLSQLQVQLTKNWSVSYQAQYDLTNKELVNQSFNFRRNLHCWEMTFRWVPTGPWKEYYLRINVKASQLQDIKFEKRGGRASHRGYGSFF